MTSIAIAVFLMIMFALVIGVPVLGIILIVRFLRWRGAGAVVAGLVIFTIAAALLGTRGSRHHGHEHHRSVTTGASHALPAEAAPAIEAPPALAVVSSTPWPQAVTEQYGADVHPAAAAAARAAARQVADQWLPAEQPDDTVINITGPATVSLQRVVAQTMRVVAPELKVIVSADANRTPAGAIRLNVFLDTLDDTPQKRLRLELDQPDGTVVANAVIHAKPWVTDADWRPPQGATGLWVVAHSPALSPSPDEAEKDALQTAKDLIGKSITTTTTGQPRAADAAVAKAIEIATRDGGLIKDRFAQSIDRPYGKLYRAAVLVRVSPEMQAQLNARAGAIHQADQRAASQQVHRRGWTIAGGSMFVALIFLVYLLLNALTKHYYLWQLRAATLTVIIGCILGTFMLV